MKSTKSSFLVYLGFLFVALLCSCAESGLSKGKSKDVIEEHFKDYYDLFVPKKAEFTFEAPPSYKAILTARKMGLINANKVSSTALFFGKGCTIEKPCMGDTFAITITDKGNSIPHLEDKYGNVHFLTSQNKINNILEVTKDQDNQFTVLFSFIEKYNDLGKEVVLVGKQFNFYWTEDNSKFRGKATIVYDSFLKKYVLRNLVRSPWEKENWYPAKWTTDEKGERVIYYGQVGARR
jgi:hypothetical protein